MVVQKIKCSKTLKSSVTNHVQIKCKSVKNQVTHEKKIMIEMSVCDDAKIKCNLSCKSCVKNHG